MRIQTFFKVLILLSMAIIAGGLNGWAEARRTNDSNMRLVLIPSGTIDSCKGYCDYDDVLYPVEISTEKADIEMVLIPPGTFLMGHPHWGTETKVDRSNVFGNFNEAYDNNGPAHTVIINTPFYLGKYEVAVNQFSEFIRATGHPLQAMKVERTHGPYQPKAEKKKYSWQDPGFSQENDSPVVGVSWLDAKSFCRWVGCRLPSEAEWEYACKAGTSPEYKRGDELFSTDLFNYNGSSVNGFAMKRGVFREKTVPVDSFLPNDWGLYNMHGNVAEYCEDYYHNSYKGAPVDGSAWIEKLARTGLELKVLRGGGWEDCPSMLVCFFRTKINMNEAYTDVGFRVARSVKGEVPVIKNIPAGKIITEKDRQRRINEQIEKLVRTGKVTITEEKVYGTPEPEKFIVEIWGLVEYPGKYYLGKGSTIKDLVRRAEYAVTASRLVILIRTNNKGKEWLYIKTWNESESKLELKNGDIIFVPFNPVSL